MKRLPIFITAVALFCGVAGAEELKLREDNIDQIVKDEIGIVFTKVLECAGVYKQTEEGLAAFRRFIEAL